MEAATGRGRLERGTAPLATVTAMLVGEISVFADHQLNGDWRVEYFDNDGGCYVTIFSGPAAEMRARDYYAALAAGTLSYRDITRS